MDRTSRIWLWVVVVVVVAIAAFAIMQVFFLEVHGPPGVSPGSLQTQTG